MCSSVYLAHFLIKRQGFGRIGQHADEVGDKAVGLKRGFHARLGGFGSGFYGVDGKTCYDWVLLCVLEKVGL